jgi:hypothetical protein
MTERPQDDERRPEPGTSQPYGQAAQQYGQQQFGQQPRYGQASSPEFNRPYGAPPAGAYGVPGPDAAPGRYDPAALAKKSRRGVIAAVTTLVVLLVAGGVVAALTLGPRILSREAVERDVAAQFEELNGVPIEIECPDDMALESGAEYTCIGITEEGEEVELAVAVTDPPGDAEYTWTEI